MANNEIISVIIPTYNREKLIKRSIESVLNQTYQDIEIIIVDDASTDNTKKEIDKINDNRIKYYKLKKNQGACHARNYGIKKASGKYIAFQDSDDVFEKEKLEKQLSNLKKNNSDLDFCKISINCDDIQVIVPSEKQEKQIYNNKILDELCNGNFISTQAILVKKDCIKKYLFDEKMPRLQDFDLLFRMTPHIKISYTNEILVNLYTQNDSIGKSDEKLKNAIILILKKKYKLNADQKDTLINWLLNNNPNYTNLQKEHLILSKEFSKLIDNYDELLMHYNDVINSKRWRMMDKICKIIKK